jgi:hypothetical protein
MVETGLGAQDGSRHFLCAGKRVKKNFKDNAKRMQRGKEEHAACAT